MNGSLVDDRRDPADGALVRNALLLADFHRTHCSGPDCTASLTLLAMLVERAGIALTDEERGRFM